MWSVGSDEARLDDAGAATFRIDADVSGVMKRWQLGVTSKTLQAVMEGCRLVDTYLVVPELRPHWGVVGLIAGGTEGVL